MLTWQYSFGMRMPRHIPKELFHLLGVRPTVLLRYDISVPQFFYYAFHWSHLLLAQHNTTEERKDPENKMLT